ncbi:hypothetical protein niasHT_035308 [Heterodera trifolii]|uniref:Ground-like domain-containing protein n=1 Tax=Heterodera trifolii TaxID=157864 RepID=A0ABD2I200_9BILA
MSQLLNCLIALTILSVLVAMTNGIGMPMQQCCCPMQQQSCCGGGGGGGGGCCGRKKREAAALEAVQPHFKSDETPCPQTEWRQVIDESIRVDDAIGSVSAIQTALFRRYADQKFLVTCSAADEAKTGTNKVHFSSSGDGYCNLVKERIWCQAVALSA